MKNVFVCYSYNYKTADAYHICYVSQKWYQQNLDLDKRKIACVFNVFVLIKFLLLHTDPLWQIWRNNCFDGKTCNFESNVSGLNSLDLKKTQKIIKGQIFFQRPNLKAKGQKIQILLFFQWFGLVCRQLFRKIHWFNQKGHKGP